jgi:hypothetical protein
MLRRSLMASVCVGSLLTILMNQGDFLFAGVWNVTFYWKIAVIMPFCLASYGALVNNVKETQHCLKRFVIRTTAARDASPRLFAERCAKFSVFDTPQLASHSRANQQLRALDCWNALHTLGRLLFTSTVT